MKTDDRHDGIGRIISSATRPFFPKKHRSFAHGTALSMVVREFLSIAIFSAVAADIASVKRRGRNIRTDNCGSVYMPLPPVLFFSAIPQMLKYGTQSVLIESLQDFYLRTRFTSLASAKEFGTLGSDFGGEQNTTNWGYLCDLWMSACGMALLVIHCAGSEESIDATKHGSDIELLRNAISDLRNGKHFFVRADGTIFVPGWLEGRKVERIDVEFDIIVRQRNRTHRGLMENISKTGMRFSTNTQIETGAPVGAELADGRILQGMIVWSSKNRHGVEFFDPLQDADPLLQKV